jgi:hypothetical protein
MHLIEEAAYRVILQNKFGKKTVIGDDEKKS